MKTIVATCLLSAAMVVGAETVTSMMACESWPLVWQMLDNAGEKPLLKGVAQRGFNQELVNFETIVFVNPDSKSFSIVERWSDSMFCVVQTGYSLHPYVENHN